MKIISHSLRIGVTHYNNIQWEGSLVWLRLPRKLQKFAEDIMFYHMNLAMREILSSIISNNFQFDF